MAKTNWTLNEDVTSAKLNTLGADVNSRATFTALATAQTDIDSRVPAADGVLVVRYGTDVTVPRPAAAVVWWIGDAGAGDPDARLNGDVIFIPDV